MEKMIKFYDTSSLLIAGESIFGKDKFAVSSITFKELERIKTSANKDAEIGSIHASMDALTGPIS